MVSLGQFGNVTHDTHAFMFVSLFNLSTLDVFAGEVLALSLRDHVEQRLSSIDFLDLCYVHPSNQSSWKILQTLFVENGQLVILYQELILNIVQPSIYNITLLHYLSYLLLFHVQT